MKRVDFAALVGTTFGLWTVVSEAGSDEGGARLAFVHCHCGFERVIQFSELRRGKSKSCGCAKGLHVSARRGGVPVARAAIPDDPREVLFVLDGVDVTAAIVARFRAHFVEGAPDECWLWLGKPNHKGYGRVGVSGRHLIATRVALSLKLGRPVSQELEARHQCDNPPCVNPHHLLEGTRQDNANDAVERKRMRSGLRHGTHTRPDRRCPGERHGMAKLTDAKVQDLRARFAAGGVSYAQLGRDFGITPGHARALALGRRWKHVLPASLPYPKLVLPGSEARS